MQVSVEKRKRGGGGGATSDTNSKDAKGAPLF